MADFGEGYDAGLNALKEQVEAVRKSADPASK